MGKSLEAWQHRLRKYRRLVSTPVDLFFFQAEDGIRYIGVTGVQTCALPIWVSNRPRASADLHELKRNGRGPVPERSGTGAALENSLGGEFLSLRDPAFHAAGQSDQIGRASCRERV